MAKKLSVLIISLIFTSMPCLGLAGVIKEKEHDFIPRVHNIVFIMDVSDSMLTGYPVGYEFPRLFVATRAFAMFNAVMPHVPLWQYDLNSALITYGDAPVPGYPGILGPWKRELYKPFFADIRREGTGPWKTAGMPEALQLAGSLIGGATGRTAVVIFSDGGLAGECPQRTAAALKKEYGDNVQVYGVWFGNREIGWRNLYETCKLTGGYARQWEEVRTKAQMKEFAWDILVREIMFPYPEIFFQDKSADLLPSEAIKLESVANFLHAIPQYVLQIDGHSNFIGNTKDNYELSLQRAKNVKEALIRMYKVHPARVLIRSWGEELPRYDNQNPEIASKNDQANLYLMLPLRNFPYDEKHLHTFGVRAVGNVFNTQERDADTEWAWPDKPAPGPDSPLPPVSGEKRRR